MRKRFLLMFIFLICFFVPFPATGEGKSTQVIRIAGDRNLPPFEYFSSSGVYSGFNVDMMNAISLQTGIRFEFYPMPWNQAIQALHQGKIDAIQGMKYSVEREKTYSFSKPYFLSSQAIFVRSDNIHIQEVADLIQNRVAVQRGDVAHDLLKRGSQIKLIEVDNQNEAIQLLSKNKIDAFVGNRITGQYFIQKNHKQKQIKIVGDPLDPQAYSLAVMPKNSHLIPIINEGIDKVKQSGIYDQIEHKWFGEYILPAKLNVDQWMFWIRTGLCIASIVLIAVVWWNRMLQREVERRTQEIATINRKLEEKMGLLEDNLLFQQQLLDSAYSCLITLDRSGAISMFNHRAQSMLLGENIVGTPYIHTPIVNLIPAKKIEACLHQNEVFLQVETEWVKNHERKIITYSLFPLFNRDQENIGVILNFSDITHKKELERRISEANRLRALGQLMAGIAHEIRNPLTSMLAYTQLLPKKRESEEFCTYYSQQIVNEIERLNQLVDDLLNYSRPKKSTPTLFELQPFTENILRLFNQKVVEKRILVKVEIPENCHVFADRQQLQQILMNMVINAIDALEERGELNIHATELESKTRITIEDNGCGIEQEDLNKLFEPFFTKKNNGVGLGLSISYQLIKENHGSIEVRSLHGQGTTFILTFPSHDLNETENPSEAISHHYQ
ncbi:polar amino acid transport system substrate-binding protein [Seinonella peptonophila]|uniref:histidine kinase n=1 Tax=Seinonella peptonophila TaxID=112248 RepID=A0A1M4SRW1_9BACL|nr:transporter substrate-binding domain-containing protein [Seinonella peptonophila]SHE34939.1 polar amino acid transport system substrate-binding protein [Seinonella peptonophila]